MGTDTLVDINGIKVNTEKADRLVNSIIAKENLNIKTKQCDEGQMISIIKKMIEEEVECY